MEIGKKAVDALNSGNNNDEKDCVRLVIHLKKLLAERGLTQTQLAEMSGVRQATISQLTRGHIERLHVPTIEKIANALNINDITQLITLESESEIMNAANPFNIDFDFPTKK